MKQVPAEIEASGPEGTQWFGGGVDRSTMTLRIGCSAEECEAVSRLLDYSGSTPVKRWRLSAPDSVGSNLDGQVHWILSRLTTDLALWRQLASQYKMDLFCGLFMERPNRGVTLGPETMRQLAERGIEIGFDIYAPDSDTAEQAVAADRAIPRAS
jgi:hypothetical protein